jgi:hypothetical protein
MRFAYADPPYLGCCKLYGHRHEGAYGCWNDPETHRTLIANLCSDYPDGWALSGTSGSLTTLLPMIPVPHRIGVWLKSFASFKPNVNPGYTWEPVIWSGGRQPRGRHEDTVRDFVLEPITLRRGLTGAKPIKVCQWILDLLGHRADDTIVDLFPGTGVMAQAVAARPFDFGEVTA